MFFGKASYQFCQWAILAIVVKMGTPAMVGILGFANAIAAPVFLFSNLNLRSVVATDVKDEYLPSGYISVRLITSGFAILVVFAVMVISGYPLITLAVVSVIALAKAVESISDIIYGIIQKHERLDFQAQSMIFKGALSLIGVGAGMYLTHSLLLSIIIMTLVWTGLLFLWDVPIAARLLLSYRELIPKISVTAITKIFWISWPLSIVSVANSLRINIPRYFIEGTLGIDALGYFTALSYIPVAGDAVIMALQYAVLPRLAKLRIDDDRKFIALLMKVVGIGAGLGMLGILFAIFIGDYFLQVVYKKEYALYNSVFIWLMISAMGAYINAFISSALIVLRRFDYLAVIAFISLSTSLIISAFTIKQYGLIGAAISILIPSWLNCILGAIAILLAKQRRQHV